MKIFLFQFFLLFFSFTSFCQKNNYKITYSHCVQKDTMQVLNSFSCFTATLTGNAKESNYTMNKIYTHLKDTSKTMADRLADKKSGTFMVKSSGTLADTFGNQVFYNKLKDSIYLREKMPEEYVITKEKTPHINWNITTDTMSIMGYHCTVAEANFRGRNYNAFFTTDIPIVAGPWKFQGLPGLILLIQDAKNQVKISATKIEYPASAPVQPFSGPGRLVSEQEYVSLPDKNNDKSLRQAEQMVASQKYFDKTNLSAKVKKTSFLYGIEIKAD